MSGMIDIDVTAAVSAVADLALKGTLVLAAAGLAALMLRRASASARHLAWAIGFGGLLALPVLGLALPAWRLPILPAEPVPAAFAVTTEPVRETRTADAAQPIIHPASRTASATQGVGSTESAAPAAAPGNGRLDALRGLALVAWMVGAALALLRLAVSLTRVRREARTARRLTAGPAAELRDRLVWRMGIDRPVTLLEGAAGCMPLTWGIVRPRILLPTGTEAWPADRLEAVLTHELAHVRRRDCAWQLVAEAACALHWFNPLAWAAARRMRLESEHACDDQVLMAGSAGADYAGHLLDVARTLRPPRAAVLAAVPMARPSQLRTRMLAVLSAERARGPVPMRLAAPALLGAGVLLALIAALTPSRAGAAEPFGVSPAPCFVPVRGSTFDEASDDRGGRSMWWSTGSCRGEARIEGAVRFTDDFTAVRSVAPGGMFRLALRDGGRVTEVVVRAGAGGGIHPSIRLNGLAQPWDAEAERWLAAALPELMAVTGYGADHRAAALLARLAADAVGGGTERARELRGEYADALLDGGLDPATLRMALDRVAAMENVSAIPDLLQRAAPALPADPGVHAAYLRAAGRIDGGAQLRRTLIALTDAADPGRAAWSDLFRQARRLGTGREMGLLLAEIASALPADAEVQAMYLDAARGMESAAELRRALGALLATRRLQAAMQARLLDQAAPLDGREMELLLTRGAPNLSREARVEEAYRAAAARIADPEARARALAAYDAPAQAVRDTIPIDRLDDPEATTILSHSDRTAPGSPRFTLLSRNTLLTRDRDAVQRIEAGGWLVFREQAGAVTRRVRVTPGADGALRYSWSGDFNGVDREAWMRRVFTHFADKTGSSRHW